MLLICFLVCSGGGRKKIRHGSTQLTSLKKAQRKPCLAPRRTAEDRWSTRRRRARDEPARWTAKPGRHSGSTSADGARRDRDRPAGGQQHGQIGPGEGLDQVVPVGDLPRRQML
jgi:hypothetical protein